MLTRRELAAGMAAAAVPRPRVRVDISRFLMKEDYARVAVDAPGYRFLWHGRFFGFRLMAPEPWDGRLSYANFGLFEQGGIDLISSHYQSVGMTRAGQPVLLFGSALYTCERPEVVRFEHFDSSGRKLRMTAEFRDSVVAVVFEPSGFTGSDPLLLTFHGNLAFDRPWPGGYWSSGLGVGLRVASRQGGVDAANGRIECRVPVDGPSQWWFTTAREGEGAPLDASRFRFQRRPVGELPSWEAAEMSRRGWASIGGGVRERVAGVYISAEGWRNPTSWLPESRIRYVSGTFLPRLAASRAFRAVGLSRDGVGEKGEQADWLRLVAQAHAAGMRVYMKPGDGELTPMGSRQDMERWAKSCFDVPPEQRCDVIRMPWEAVLNPWVCASLCLPEKFYTPRLRALGGKPWPEVKESIVTALADRFSWAIEAIRRYSPAIVIDLESADTAVLEVLLRRHANLGVMYMTYGQHPRAAEYLDLYHCAAHRQAGARRVVMETDCYYSTRVTGLGLLRSKPYADLYSPEDIALMARKHRYMNRLGADAAWAWGMNITLTDAKFDAICAATG